MADVLQILGSFETLLSDVKNVRTSELSVKRLAVLIDEEFRVESKHMEPKDDCAPRKNFINKDVFILLGLLMKWTMLFVFMSTITFALFPGEYIELVGQIQSSIYNINPSAPKHNVSAIPWNYIALQVLRRGSLSIGLERRFPPPTVDVDACIVDNPLYQPPRVRCFYCKGGFIYGKVPEHQTQDSPVVRKNNNVAFNIARLQQVLQRNEIMMNQYTTHMETTCDYIHTVEDLKENRVLDHLEGDNTSHIVVTFLSYMSSHILRQEFPRPQDYFVSTQTAFSYLYVDGKNSSSYRLTKPVLQLSFMYTQSSGSRRLVFSPPDYCNYKCQTFSRIMKTGDIVLYSNMWTVYSEPAGDASLAFVDTYDWLD